MQGNPLLERRYSAHGDNEPRTGVTFINGEASPAQYGPTPSGRRPFRQELLYGWWQSKPGFPKWSRLDAYLTKAENGEIGAEGHVNRLGVFGRVFAKPLFAKKVLPTSSI